MSVSVDLIDAIDNKCNRGGLWGCSDDGLTNNLEISTINGIRVAIQVHVFYVDLIVEIKKYLDNIPFPFDLFISTDSDDKCKAIEEVFCNVINAKVTSISVFQNRGRDVAPFITQLGNYVDNYDYICHVHTKKSKHLNYFTTGNEWRSYLFDNLLGSKSLVGSIIDIFESNPDIGIVCPYPFKPISPWADWGKNLETTKTLLRRVCDKEIDLP